MKEDKGFRIKVILIGLLLLMFYNSTVPKKTAVTEEGCNALMEPESGFDWGCYAIHCVGLNWWNPLCAAECIDDNEVFKYEAEDCIKTDGCYLQSKVKTGNALSNTLGCWHDSFNGVVEKCTTSVPNGEYVFDSMLGCESHDGRKVGTICGYEIYECRAPADPDKIINDREADIAKVVQGIGLFKDDSHTAYIVGILGIGMLVFMMVSVV